MRDIILNEVLIPSLRVLYEMDYDNIRFGVSVVKGQPTRVGFKMDGDKKVRFAKKTGEVID